MLELSLPQIKFKAGAVKASRTKPPKRCGNELKQDEELPRKIVREKVEYSVKSGEELLLLFHEKYGGYGDYTSIRYQDEDELRLDIAFADEFLMDCQYEPLDIMLEKMKRAEKIIAESL